MVVSKVFLNINGVDRMFVCDHEKDTLAGVLRKMGLTSVKVGCGTGQCGACSVLLNGKVVRSCTRKIKSIDQYSKVETLEGIGTPINLHPLQQAWITYNGTQCGFCTPGFIMSAKGLLDQNLNPTREEVRDWFQKHRNACRCTGYKVLVDAVMEAAAVMRGEKRMEDITFITPADGKIYGSSQPRPMALAKVTGTCDYGDDINVKLPDGVLHMAPVFAGVSHGKIKGIDSSEALKMPGVIRIITHEAVKGTNRINFPIGKARSKTQGNDQPILAADRVLRYGDVCALVVANSRREARDAASKVIVAVETLPEYLNALEAVDEDAMEIHEGVPNIFLEQPHFYGGNTKPALEKAAYQVSGSYYTQRQPHLVLEPECGLSYIDEEDNVVIQYKSQTLYFTKACIASGIGVPAEKIRIVANNAGGSFGYSMSPTYPALLAVAALVMEKPCAMTMSFEEHQHFAGKRAPSFSNVTLAVNEEGRLTAFEYELAYDIGPYTQFVGPLIDKGPTFMGFPYMIPNAMGLTKLIYTNHNYNITYRAYGTVSTAFATESIVDELAHRMAIDPLEFRYKNILREGDICLSGYKLCSYRIPEMIDKLRPRYLAAMERAKKESTPERKIGVGVTCSTYKAGAGVNDSSEIYLELNPDGSVTQFNSWEDMGQGADVGTLVHTHEALRPLGLRPDQIKLVQNDTRYCPNSGPAAGSRSHYMNGNATIDAAEKLMAAMRKPDGTFRTYDEMVAEGIPIKYSGIFSASGMTDMSNVDANTGLGKNASVNSYAVVMAVVAVDTATGKVTVLSVDGEADIGRIGSFQAVEGQAHSAIMHGIGLALQEDYENIKKCGTMIGCGFPYITDVPDAMNINFIDSYRKTGPQGSAGCSEPLQSGPAAAVINAVFNACGVRIRELPATADKVIKGLKDLKEGKETASVPYYLGCDFDEHMEELKKKPV